MALIRMISNAKASLLGDIRKKLRPGSKEFEKFFKLAAVRYRGWAQERFDTYSRGGGDWPPLKTKRKRGDTKKASILRDTNTLFRVFTPVFIGSPGAVENLVRDGIEVGFGGGAKHPSGAITIGDLAEIHHRGLGVNPERRLLDDPPREVTDQMEKDLVRIVENA